MQHSDHYGQESVFLFTGHGFEGEKTLNNNNNDNSFTLLAEDETDHDDIFMR